MMHYLSPLVQDSKTHNIKNTTTVPHQHLEFASQCIVSQLPPPPPPLGGVDCVDYPPPLSCHLDSHLGTCEPPMEVVATSTSHMWEHTYRAHARSWKQCHDESRRMISGPINLVREIVTLVANSGDVMNKICQYSLLLPFLLLFYLFFKSTK
jgi:hypothetical protein